MSTLSEIEVSNDIRLSEFTVNVNDCIALCHIAQSFDDFTKNLIEFSKGFKGYTNLDNLYHYIKDDKKVNRSVRDFYVQNYKVLDSIHKYTYISNFLLIYFDNKTGKFTQEITEMYEYIKNNINKKDKILAVLDKLSKLGFESVTFNQNEKFDDVYEYNKLNDREYYFLDGEIEVIPSLEDFKYRSNGANYEIKFSKIPFHKAKITLNNLVFDANYLPNNMSYDNTFKKILDLKKEKQESYKVLSDVVGLDYNLEKIMPAIEKIDELINDIHNCKHYKYCAELIISAKQKILSLKGILEEYEQDMVKQGLIDSEILEQEKRNVKKRSNNYIILK